MAALANDRNEVLNSATSRVVGGEVYITTTTSAAFTVAKDASVATPSSITLAAEATKYSSPTYTWYRRIGGASGFTGNFVLIDGATTANLVINGDFQFLYEVGEYSLVEYKVICTQTDINTSEAIISIPVLREGSNGIVAGLSISSILLPASSDGTVSSYNGAETSFITYNGSTNATDQWSYYVSATGGGVSYQDSDDSTPRTGTGPIDGGLGGVNLLTTSNVLAAGTGTTFVANQTVGPDGTTTMGKLVASATTGGHEGSISYTWQSGTTYTLSGYIKSDNSALVNGFNGGGNSTIGSVGQMSYNFVTNTGTGATFTQLQNGLVKFVVTFTPNASNTSLFFLRPTSNGSSTFTGNGTSGVFVGSLQLETGSVANEYAPTDGVARSGTRGYVKIVALTQDSSYLDITATKIGYTSITRRLSVSKSKQGVQGVPGTPGTSPLVYSIVTSAPVITKDAVDAATTGTYSSITIQGKKYDGNTTTNFGYVTITANGTTEATTATDASTIVTLSPATTAGKSSYTIKLYNQATVAGATLLDTQVIYVVYKGVTGSAGTNAISVILSNEAHVLPASAGGVVSSYVGSGTDIRVYEGATELTYDGTGTANSTWKVVVTTATNITAGTITDSGTYATVLAGSVVADNIDTSSILFTITGKNSSGTSFTVTKQQTLSKSKQGTSVTGNTGQSNHRIYIASTNSSTVPATPSTTVSGAVPANWSLTPVTLTTGQAQFQSDGVTPAGSTTTTWGAPYLSYFKVGSLSAISADLGSITAGSLDINSGIAKVDSLGNATFKSIEIKDSAGNLIMKSGETVTLDLGLTSISNVPSNMDNASITVNADGSLSNAGTGAPSLGSISGSISHAQFNDDFLIINIDGTDIDVELRFDRTTGGPASITWNGVTMQCSKPFISSELGINNISATAPANPFAKQVWLDVS